MEREQFFPISVIIKSDFTVGQYSGNRWSVLVRRKRIGDVASAPAHRSTIHSYRTCDVE